MGPSPLPPPRERGATGGAGVSWGGHVPRGTASGRNGTLTGSQVPPRVLQEGQARSSTHGPRWGFNRRARGAGHRGPAAGMRERSGPSSRVPCAVEHEGQAELQVRSGARGPRLIRGLGPTGSSTDTSGMTRSREPTRNASPREPPMRKRSRPATPGIRGSRARSASDPTPPASPALRTHRAPFPLSTPVRSAWPSHGLSPGTAIPSPRGACPPFERRGAPLPRGEGWDFMCRTGTRLSPTATAP